MADVFISHSSKDKEIADLICEALESRGAKCWIAPRDIQPGSDWSAKITEAIHDSRVFIIIYSENSVSSVQVPREITLAGSSDSVIIPYKIDNAELTPNFEYYLMSCHWITADTANRDFKLDELYDAVMSALSGDSAKPNFVNRNSASKKLPGRILSVIGIILSVIMLALLITTIVFWRTGVLNDSYGEVTQKPPVKLVTVNKDCALSPEEKMPIQSYETTIVNGNTKDVLGFSYVGYIFSEDGYIGFDNYQEYTSLNFKAYNLSGANEEVKFFVQVDGVDKEVIEFAPGDKEPRECEVDIAGARTVLIEIYSDSNKKYPAMIDSMYFSKNGATPESFEVKSKPAPDTAYSPVDKIPYLTSLVVTANNTTTAVKVNGDNKNTGFGFYPDGTIIYDNKEEYKKLSFYAVSINNDEASLFVEADDETTYKYVVNRKPQLIELDINGLSEIQISAPNENLESGKQCLFVYDVVLSK